MHISPIIILHEFKRCARVSRVTKSHVKGCRSKKWVTNEEHNPIKHGDIYLYHISLVKHSVTRRTCDLQRNPHSPVKTLRPINKPLAGWAFGILAYKQIIGKMSLCQPNILIRVNKAPATPVWTKDMWQPFRQCSQSHMKILLKLHTSKIYK